MGKLRRVLKQVCLLHKEELDFLRGEKERLESERDEWREKALNALPKLCTQGSVGSAFDENFVWVATDGREYVTDFSKAMDALRDERDRATARAEELGRQMKAVHSEKIQLHRDLAELESQNDKLAEDRDTWQKRADRDADSAKLREESTGLEMAVAILTADRDNLKEARAKAEYEAQNFAKDRDAWKKAYDVLKVDCGPIELTRLPDRCEDCEWKELAEKRSAEIAEIEKTCNGLRIRQDEWRDNAKTIESELATRAQQFREEKRELSITIEDLKDKLTAAINDLQATRTECTCHTEDNRYYECPVCEIKRVRGEAESLQKELAQSRQTVREMSAQADDESHESYNEIVRLANAAEGKADRLKAELEDVRAAFISVTGYKDRVRAIVGQLVKVASSE